LVIMAGPPVFWVGMVDPVLGIQARGCPAHSVGTADHR